MIQMSQVASLFTLFTHHAKTSEDLVKALRNNLLQVGAFNNEKIAEQQVADVINFDIHLAKDISGHRYIERITEIIPAESSEYPDIDLSNSEESFSGFVKLAREYFTRMTDRKIFETRDIVKYENGVYKVISRPSSKQLSEIKQNLTEKEYSDFKTYLDNFFQEVCNNV